jgi:hypothetical protein
MISVKFKTIPEDGYMIERHVVLHEYFLKDGALDFTVSAAMADAQVLGGIGRKTAWPNFIKQIKDLHNREPVKPFEHPDHRNLPIDHRCIDDGAVYTEIELPYSLRLPCLTKATLTPRLFELAMDLQRLFPQDNIHLNEIIMAIFVWCDHESHPDRHIEGAFLRIDGTYIDPESDSFHRVPRVDLTDFVAIWPHYLRFHEMNQLATYVHPLRFVNALNNTAREAHRVPNNSFFFRREKNPAWEEVAMREVARSKLQHDADWQRVVPAFFSGSLLKRPTDWKPPPDDLGERLALPDIHMIGHPTYPAGDPTITRVITPLPWINPVVDRTQSWEGQGNEPIVMESSITTQRGFSNRWGAYDTLRLISGDQMTVAGPPRPLEPTDDPSVYEVAEGDSEEEGELHPAKTLKTLSFGEELAWRKQA